MSENKDAKDFTVDNSLDLFFNDFIKKGNVEKEGEIVPGFTIRLKVLNTGEILCAETVMRMTQNMPSDIVQKVRGASILSQSIISINKMPVVPEDCEVGKASELRTRLYKRLLEMPAFVIQKSYELYIEAVFEQNKIYSNPVETAEKITNF